MWKKLKQQKGITIMALVIMIIILIILAGITITSITSDNGVIKEARTAKELAEKAALEEQVELSIIRTEQKHRNPTVDDVIEQLIKDKIISKEEQVDRKTGNITTDAGYVIEGKLDDYIGKKPTGGDNTTGDNNTTGGNNTSDGGEISVPDLKEGEVEFILSEKEWTNQAIKVELECSITGYSLEYSTDGSNWNKYRQSFSVNDNGYIYARLSNSSGKTGGSVKKEITNIDKLKPEQFTPTATSTTNSITLTGSTTDAAKTATDGSSGIDKYYFSKDNGTTWGPTNGQTETSYTFNGLTQNQTYTLKMKAVDKVGNEIITESIIQKTITVPDLTTSNVTFSYNPTGWTNGNVAVTIAQTVGSNYSLQYATENPSEESSWRNYTTPISMSANGPIYARIKDSTGQTGGYATGNVTKIDKTGPEVSVEASEITETSIILNVTANDSQSGLAIENTYQYYLGDTLVETSTTNSYKFTGLGEKALYVLKVIVIDKAGNRTEKSIVQKTLAKSYVGYYADIEGDGIVDGIIYADLAIGNTGSGTWGTTNWPYTIPIEEETKEYYVSKKAYTGAFGVKDVLTPSGTGNNRFYVMALTDIDGRTNGTVYDWYNAAGSVALTDPSTMESREIGAGKSNTITMIAKWNAKTYGAQNKCSTNKDIWGQIQAKANKGWFVPSVKEWCAFAGELEITKTNYADFGISNSYWTSSLYGPYDILTFPFDSGYVNFTSPTAHYNARLSITF